METPDYSGIVDSMKWRTYENEEGMHIAPIVQYGFEWKIMIPHKLSKECPCHPEKKEFEGNSTTFFIHNVIH